MCAAPIIVCVDDDEAMLATITRCLRRGEFDIRATTSASEALSLIAMNDVAVLVSDYDMPEMTGAQLAGQVRRIRPETVRILLTGKRTLETAIDGINQGEVFRFLSKPFDNDQLRAAVAAGLERNQELLALSGDRQRRERRAQLRNALETEYPGISHVERSTGGVYEIVADPWSEASELGLVGLTRGLDT